MLKQFKKKLLVIPLLLLFMSCPMFTFEEVEEYTVTVTSSNGGTVSPSQIVVEDGDSVTIVATPNSGYTFKEWTGDYTSNLETITFTVTRDMNLVAEFQEDNNVAPVDPGATPTSYSITVTTNNSTYGTVSSTESSVNYGGSTTIEASPLSGYKFLRWEGDYNGTDNPYTFTNVRNNISVNAIFAELSAITYTVNISSNNSNMGTVDITNTVVESGNSITITPTPLSGYRFTGWSGDNTSTANPLTISVNSNINLVANFEPIPQINDDSWTILVHFAIDNDIDYEFETNNGFMTNYINTLKSVKAADTNNKLKIIMLMDGYSGGSTFQDGYYELSGSGTFSDDLVISKNEINSGNVSEVNEFISWAVNNYRSEKYVYSVFNHGGGFNDQNITATYGIGFDDSNNDALSHYELAEIASHMKGQIGKNIDLFYTYACLMGGVELAYEVRDSADYILFSEELFPADTWSYEALNTIALDPTITPQQLGINFCDSAYSYFNGRRKFTLSLIDLSYMNSLYNSINSYANTAIGEINSNVVNATELNTIVSNTLKMNYNKQSDYYLDLGDYLNGVVSSTNLSSTLKNSAQDVLTSYNNAVVYNTEYNKPTSTGMTIYHTSWYVGVQYDLNLYRSILTFANNSWSNYLELFNNSTQPWPGDNFEPNDSFATAATNFTLDVISDANINTSDDIDYYKVTYSGSNSIVIFIESDNTPLIYSIYDSSYNLLDSNVQWGQFEIDESFPGGDYYFVVDNNDQNPETGTYKFKVKEVQYNQDDIYEPDNSFAEAKELVLNETRQDHSFSTGSDFDYMYIDMVAGTRYKIQTYGTTGLTDCDTYLHLYDSSETKIVSNDDYEGFYSRIIYEPTTSGRYYIKVNSFNAATIGYYSIDLTETTLSLTSESNNSYSKIK